MKNIYTSNENDIFENKENITSSDSERPILDKPGMCGDIDELIFPNEDDYYISQR